MAHTKAAGAAKRTVNVAGKRLGIKKFAGEHVQPGNIIVRQRGTKFHPGNGVMIGKDHTIFAVTPGFVEFRQMTGYKRAKKLVDVVPVSANSNASTTKATKPAAKTTAAKTEAKPKKAASKPKTSPKKSAKK